MKTLHKLIFCGFGMAISANGVAAQTGIEPLLCEAAQDSGVIELVYDTDEARGCEPRIVDVHQVAIGNNGKRYVHGYQHRGCVISGTDRPAERTFRLDKIKTARRIGGDGFTGQSAELKQDGWDGCLGDICFIEKNICE